MPRPAPQPPSEPRPPEGPVDPARPATLVDGETGAWALSFAVHLGVLFLLAALTAIIPLERRPLLTAAPLEPIEELLPEEFRFSDETEDQIGALADAGSTDAAPAAPLPDIASEVLLKIEPTALTGTVEAFEITEPVMTSPTVSEDMLVKGVGAVGATGAAGAVDRITQEILNSIDLRPTLVVWLFDQSGSLKPQREEIAQRFDHIYEQLGVIAAAGDPAFAKHKDKPLLTAVASFGKGSTLLTPEPTDDLAEVQAAVRAIKDDDAGVENIFTAIGTVATQFRNYRLKSPRRNVMIVVFSDEAGNDVGRVDETVDLCRKLEIPVYVVGVPAPFGRREAFVKYVDPDPMYDQSPQRVAVEQGPESLAPERINLRFLGQREEETLDSGFGPFALTRLCYETGGVYFTVHPNRTMGGEVQPWQTSPMATYMSRFFDERLMRRYRPDYVSVAEYQRGLLNNRAKSALVQAANLSLTEPMEDVRLDFPKLEEAQFAESLSRAQRDAAVLEPRLERLVGTLQQGEPGRRTLTEPRWQAGFDLAIGRAMAAQVRTEGYNTMLAQAKMGMAFKDKKSDTWVLRPSDNISSGSVLSKQAEKAITYLEGVVKQHEGTPWALLAQRELSTPLGWEWREEFRDLAGRLAQREANANNPRPMREEPVPPRKERRPPPKL